MSETLEFAAADGWRDPVRRIGSAKVARDDRFGEQQAVCHMHAHIVKLMRRASAFSSDL
ncbi:hypothetical protein [Paraburkholderia terrae]|uniref:hypothetical protein n=1 Tax=Paraburkholderia terrae TaxID=311230 RepID=UPI0033654A6D